MKYVSVDIETTGLDVETCQVLEIGAVIEDCSKVIPLEELPKYHCIINHKQIIGQPYAINMNARIFKILSEYIDIKDKDLKEQYKIKYNILEPDEVAVDFFYWLFVNNIIDNSNENLKKLLNGHVTKYKDITVPTITSKIDPIRINVAGKNFGTFDKVFLEQLPRWKQLIRINQRIIDPSILFVNWKSDNEIPNLITCKKRAALNEVVSHEALEDALDIVKLIRFYRI